MHDLIRADRYVKGRVRLYNLFPLGRAVAKSTTPILADPRTKQWFTWNRPSSWVDNELLYEWGTIVGNLLMRTGLNYGIAGMYIEFQNVPSPGDTVTPPSFTRDPASGITYYDGLAGSENTDYLRVPLTSAVLNSSNTVNFPYGNQPTFFAQTGGVVGVHGLSFSSGNNSVVYGGALVAFVNDADPTQDLILSRFYLTAEQQVPKLPNAAQIGLQWQLSLV